jgi:hypothetical protein
MCLIYLQFPRGFEIFLLSEREIFFSQKHTREKFGQKENEYAEGENFQKSTGISKKTRARVLLLFFSRLFVTASYCLV